MPSLRPRAVRVGRKTALDDFRRLLEIPERLQDAGFEDIKRDVGKVLGPQGLARIALFDLRAPNGQLGEFYLPTPELEGAKKPGSASCSRNGGKRRKGSDPGRAQAARCRRAGEPQALTARL